MSTGSSCPRYDCCIRLTCQADRIVFFKIFHEHINCIRSTFDFSKQVDSNIRYIGFVREDVAYRGLE